MAKVTRKKMARGVELTVDQVFDPISAMATELSNARIEGEQLEHRYATFRMNFNIPWLGSKYFYDNRTSGVTGVLSSGGEGYTNVAATRVATTGGSGTGLTVNTLATITDVAITTGGTAYIGASGVPTTGGTGLGLTVNTTDTAGVITGVTISNAGSGYTDGDVLTILGPVIPPALPCTITLTIAVSTATIRDVGSGYTDGDVLTIAGGTTSAEFTLSVVPDTYDGPMYIPFCLPPLQEDITQVTAGNLLMKAETPFPVLDEVSFSLDQSDEPAMVLDQWYGRDQYQYSPARRWMPNPYAGKKTYTRTDAYEFTLSIYEKEQFYFNDSTQEVDQFGVGGEAVSLTIPSSAFISRSTRFNPIAVGGVNRQFNPFKTYCMAIFAPKLHDASTNREHCTALNVWVSLKFKMPLTARDVATSPELVQNIPLHYGDRLPGPTVTPVVPVAGDPVVADGQSGGLEEGISTNLQNIDQQFSDKLRGGYNEFAQKYPTQDLQDDAAYEVLTVPLGAGFPHNRMSARDDFPLAPYVMGSRFGPVALPLPYAEQPYIDRRVIPIDGDMTIHHVVVALNWTSDKLQTPYDPAVTGAITYDTTTMPGAPNKTVKYAVGVGMLCGPRADNFSYQQVAYSEFTPNPTTITTGLPDGVIDLVKMGLPASQGAPAEWALISVPIVHQTAGPLAANGTGYWGADISPVAWAKGHQGTPFFVGEGNSYTRVRTPVGLATAAGGTEPPFGAVLPNDSSMGCEQFLEVRLSVAPSNQVNVLAGPAGPTQVQPTSDYLRSDIFLGYGGCWVYIIGKKHLK